MAKDVICRRDLQWQLVKAAMVRSGLTLSSMVIFALAFIQLNNVLPEPWSQVFGLGVLVGGPIAVGMAVTKYKCRPMVKCPYCKESLWDCGTGNFKPRRMKVKAEATCCPNCLVPIKETEW